MSSPVAGSLPEDSGLPEETTGPIPVERTTPTAPSGPSAAAADPSAARQPAGMSKISQSIAASLASRDKRLQRDLPGPAAGSTRTSSAPADPRPDSDRPAAQRTGAAPADAPAWTGAAATAGPGTASPASPAVRASASPSSPADTASPASPAPPASGATLGPAAAALVSEAKPTAQIASPKSWVSPITSPSSSRPWSQPEVASPADSTVVADQATGAVDPVPVGPAVDEVSPVGPAKPDRRFRRFWEKSATPAHPAAAAAAPGPVPAEDGREEGRTAADRSETGQVSASDSWQNLPAHHSATPTGHLGAVPRTAAALPAPVPAAAPASLAKPVTPTTIRPASPTSKVRQTRKARLRVARIDPWSVMKTALLFGVAGAIMIVVAVFVVFSVIDSTGLYQAVNDLVSTVLTNPNSATVFDIKTYVNTQRAVGLAALIGVLDVIIITALATVMAFLYNLAANVMGGIEITLAED